MTTQVNAILEKLNTIIISVSPNAKVDYVSPYAEKLLGYPAASLLGDGWFLKTRSTNEDRILNRNFVLSLLASREAFVPVSYERPLVDVNGDTKWIQWNVSIDESGSLIGIGYDITDRKLTEQKLIKKNRELQKKNKQVSESIEYAKRIQEAVLSDPEALKNYFADAFIFYKPKDIVSGDLYWYFKKGNKTFFAIVDCTGHGVPGALMSVLASGFLRDVIIKRDAEDPSQILRLIDGELTLALSKEDGSIAATDGMDIALAVYDEEKKALEYAGAFRPLLLIRKNEIIEYKGSRYPIGFYSDVEKIFETHSIAIEAGDTAYLFSDGITDQFGGENRKKLNRKRFYDLLLNTQDMELTEQASFLEYSLSNWRQQEPQTDDIVVMGVRF